MLSRLLRWQVALAFYPVGVFFCLFSSVISPYTTWGPDPGYVRPIAAEWSVNFAAISLVVMLLCVFASRETVKKLKLLWQILIAAALLLFILVDVYRIVWIEFVVLPQAGQELRTIHSAGDIRPGLPLPSFRCIDEEAIRGDGRAA